MAVEVRKATPEDVDWLLSQLRDFDAFIARKRSFLEDETVARKILRELIAIHVALIAHDEGERFGFIMGYHTPHPFNPRIRTLVEIFWWVAVAHRTSRAGAMLLDKFEEIGRATADWTLVTLEHNSPIRDSHLTKRGFQPVERAFLLEV